MIKYPKAREWFATKIMLDDLRANNDLKTTYV